MCGLSRAEQGSLTSLLGDLQAAEARLSATYPEIFTRAWADHETMLAALDETGLLRLALGDELPGGAGLQAPGRGGERGQHEEHERDDVNAGAVEADASDGEQLGVEQVGVE